MNSNVTGTTLSADEAALVADLVRSALSNLREEIYKTENYDLRQELHQREALLKGLLSRLEGGA
ncbi:MAG TPA: hypothetical protein VH916_11210 [Dehalococcoidia bacterium]